MTNKRFKVVETVKHDGKKIYELTGDDVGYYNFREQKLLAELICNELNNIIDENEQLKKELKDYHNAFDCSQCKYQNYNWFDDGDEFEVCDKGNNEAQMDNHSCKDWEEL